MRNGTPLAIDIFLPCMRDVVRGVQALHAVEPMGEAA